MEEETELDLMDIFAIIKKRIWLIFIITLLTTFVSAIVKNVQAYADAFVERGNTLIPDGDVKIMDSAQITYI
jgi:capsular polysaccharide biosynthesis protein